MNRLRPFHLAIPIDNLEKAKKFYGELLGFEEGRSTDHWVDYNFFGHQLVCHIGDVPKKVSKEVDGKMVPVPHFGVILDWQDFDLLSEKIKESKLEFVIEPYLRFEGKPGEQKTMFFQDPFGNSLDCLLYTSPSPRDGW